MASRIRATLFGGASTAVAKQGIVPDKIAHVPHPGIDVEGTTKTWVPNLIRQDLRARANIDESESTNYPAHRAVRLMEKRLGWNPETSAFIDPTDIHRLSAAGVGTIPADAEAHAKNVLAGRRVVDLLDIVVPTIRNLHFL